METWMKWVFDGIWWYQILDLGTNEPTNGYVAY